MEKYGLVLGGGGSRGAYQAGAIKALIELGFQAEIVTGTSVGSINASVYAQQDFSFLEDVWGKITYRQVVKHKFKWKNKAREILCKAPWKQGFELSPLKKLLKRYLNEDKIRSSRIKLGLVYTGPRTTYCPFSIDDIPTAQLVDFVIASCSATPLLKATTLKNGLKCTDGGFTDNVPVALAAQMGATKIIAIKLMSGTRKPYNKKSLQVLYLKPSKRLPFFLNFDKDKLKAMFKMGYEDTLAKKEQILKFLHSDSQN
ncbi:MAG: patatin-like phospholipase family protein [Clostridia bacterium]|nr:patatin-like phospholipase family protein [Clostridia bacterium]